MERMISHERAEGLCYSLGIVGPDLLPPLSAVSALMALKPGTDFVHAIPRSRTGAMWIEVGDAGTAYGEKYSYAMREDILRAYLA